MIKLNKSGVLYDDASHKYYYNGRELKGITGMLHEFVFPNMYKNVDKETLERAKERGTLIHEQVELFASLGAEPSLGCVKEFKSFLKENGYEIVGSEYVIRIGEYHASAIDLVVHKIGAPDDEVEIWDIKCTYSVNRPYVCWQNSLYKYGFECLNPSLKVVKIRCMWLRDDAKRGTICKLVDLDEPRAEDEIMRLFQCEKEHKLYGESDESTPYYIINNEIALMDVQEKIAKLKETEEELKKAIFDGMTKNNLSTYRSERFTYSLKAGSQRESLDKDNMNDEDKKIYDDLFARYKKVTFTKPTLAIKSKKAS